MDRRSKARRRFHTDRVVRARRARYLRENAYWIVEHLDTPWLARRLSYGALASTDPWDCGRPHCGVCHTPDPGRRSREKREWRVREEV